MLPEKQQKLTQLIRESDLLDGAEKAEWEGLLGLMNDAQGFELERILKSVQDGKSSPGLSFASLGGLAEPKFAGAKPAAPPSLAKPLNLGVKPPVVPIKPQKPTEEKISLRKEVQPGLAVDKPNLNHIMNLPGQNRGKLGLGIMSDKDFQKKENLPSGGGLLKKLKQTLEEKELPAGHAEPWRELELPDPTAPKVQPPKLKVAPEKTAAQGAGIKSLPHINIPTKPKVVSEPEAGLKSLPSNLNGFSAPAPTSPVLQADKPEEPVDTEEEENTSPKPLEPEVPPFNFRGLEDIAALKAGDLKAGPKALALGLKQQAARFGYYAVTQNLEKSPLYISYIATGSSMLGNKSLDSENLLSLQQLEQTADMLMDFQAG